ncbi:MAG TPA: hypothetical protein VN777_07390 [Terriglobales bacterium]|nr:hypothetical protein [Terriglobales bacterium]HZW92884.1 hypothetical protein [Candidatus Eremiobacteraceae bacterium]
MCITVFTVENHRSRVTSSASETVVDIKTRRGQGRKIRECIDLAKTDEDNLGYVPVPDHGFAKDVQAAIDGHDVGPG